jgi:hypothetical protein
MRIRCLAIAVAVALSLVLTAQLSPAGGKGKGDPVKIQQKWSGLYPVKSLDLLPKDVRTTAVGYIADAKTFEAVWKAFKSDDKAPEVNFKDNLVVFSRNVQYLNKLDILAVTIKDGTLDILAKQTQTAAPIEDKLYISFAVIPRAGVKAIQNGDLKLQILDPDAK